VCSETWKSKRVHIVTDNVCAMWNINNGTSVNLASLQLLKELFDLSLKFNFTISASVIRSAENCVADSISRLHENGQLQRFLDTSNQMYGYNPYVIDLNRHMSVKSVFPVFADSKMDTLAAQLDTEVEQLRSLTFSESTKKCYATHLRTYNRFCNLIGCSPTPLSQVNLCRFIAFLGRTRKYNTVTQYLNIVRILHLEKGLENPLTGNFTSACVLKGLKRKVGDSKRRKKPITPTLLLQIKGKLDFSNIFDVCFWAACLTCFFGLLRISNVCYGGSTSNKHCIKRSDITFSQDGCIINIKSSKTIQYADRIFQVALPFMRDNPLCPTSTLISFISKAGGAALESNDLFSYQWNGISTRLCQVRLRARLKQRLSLAEETDYNSHSFRRGGCSFLLSSGVSLTAIKAIGDWKSMAVFDYLQPDLKTFQIFSSRSRLEECKLINCVRYLQSLPIHYIYLPLLWIGKWSSYNVRNIA